MDEKNTTDSAAAELQDDDLEAVAGGWPEVIPPLPPLPPFPPGSG